MDNGTDKNRNNTAGIIPEDEGKTHNADSRPSESVLSYSPRFDKRYTNKPASASAAGNAPHNPHKKSTAKPVYYSKNAAGSSSGQKSRNKKKAVRSHPQAHSSGSNKTGNKEKYKKVARERNIAGLKRTLLIFAILLVIFFAFYGGYRLTNVREIIITGSEKYDSGHIMDICGIQTGHNIFTYDLQNISERINTIPELTVVTAKRHFPNKIEILVTDHEPRAAIPAGNGSYTIIDAEGFVMSVGMQDTEGLILINGLASKSFKPGSMINQIDNPDLRSSAALEFIKWVDACAMDDIVSGIDVSNISCIKLIMKNNFTAVLGTYPEAADNVQKAKKAYEILLPRYPEGGIINLFNNTTQVDFTPNKSKVS